MVDPLIAVNVEHPGFKSLFADPALPSELTGPGRELQASVVHRLEPLFRARAPQRSSEELARAALVAVSVFRGRCLSFSRRTGPSATP